MPALHYSRRLVPTAIALVVLGFPVPFAGARPAGADAPGLIDPSVLNVHTGDLTVTEDGATVSDLEIRGSASPPTT